MEKFEDAKSSLEDDVKKMEYVIVNNSLLYPTSDPSDEDPSDEDVDEIKRQFAQQMQTVRGNFNQNLDGVQQSFNEGLIGKTKEQRLVFKKGAEEALRSLTNLFSKLLHHLNLFIVSICRWIKEKAEKLYDRIAEAFRNIRQELFGK